MKISDKARRSKVEEYTEEGSIERLIATLSEVYGKPKEEIAQLALVRLEKERIGGEHGKKDELCREVQTEPK